MNIEIQETQETKNKQIYNTLYKNYNESLEVSYTQNNNFSSSRRGCWNACSQSVLLNDFIKKCKTYNLPTDWYQWAIYQEEDLSSSGAIYSG